MELSKTHFCTKQTSKISSRWARSRFHILSLSRWLNNICTFDYLICFTQHGFFYSFCPILKKFSYEVVMFAIQHQYWDCFSYWCENFRKKCVASFFLFSIPDYFVLFQIGQHWNYDFSTRNTLFSGKSQYFLGD